MVVVKVAYFLYYHYTPYATEQGIISAKQGIPLQEQGISVARNKIIAA
jgi:hypothetical protein